MKKYLKFAILGLLVLGLYFYLSMDSSNEEFELAPSISTESNLAGSLTSSGFYKLTKEQLALTASQACPDGYELKESIKNSGVDMAFVFKAVLSDVDQNMNLLRGVSESHQFSFLKFDYEKYTEVEKPLIARVVAGEMTKAQAQAELAGKGFYRNFSKYYKLQDVNNITKFLRPFEPLIVISSKPFKYCGMSDSALLGLEKDFNPVRLEPKFWNIVYLPEMNYDSDIFDKIYSSDIFKANDERSFTDGQIIPKGVYRVKFKNSLRISSENTDVRGSADVLASRIQAFLPKDTELTLANDVSEIKVVKSLDNLLCNARATFESLDDRGPVEMISKKVCSNFDIETRKDDRMFNVKKSGSDLKISRSGNYYELPRLLKISYIDTSGLDKVIYFHKSFIDLRGNTKPSPDENVTVEDSRFKLIDSVCAPFDCSFTQGLQAIRLTYDFVLIDTFQESKVRSKPKWSDVASDYHLINLLDSDDVLISDVLYNLKLGEGIYINGKSEDSSLDELNLDAGLVFKSNIKSPFVYIAIFNDVLLDMKGFKEGSTYLPLAMRLRAVDEFLEPGSEPPLSVNGSSDTEVGTIQLTPGGSREKFPDGAEDDLDKPEKLTPPSNPRKLTPDPRKPSLPGGIRLPTNVEKPSSPVDIRFPTNFKVPKSPIESISPLPVTKPDLIPSDSL